MNLSERFRNIMSELLISKTQWHISIVGVWGHYEYLLNEKKIKGVSHIIPFNFPNSKDLIHTYTVGELLSAIDGESDQPNMEQSRVNLDHLCNLFSFLEALAREGDRILKWNFWKDKDTINIIKLIAFLDKANIHLSEDEINEIKLGKKVRNCYSHNGGKIDKKLKNQYNNARSPKQELKCGDPMRFNFPDFENWHDMIERISTNLNNFIESK